MNQRRGPALWATAIITLAAVWLSTTPAKAIPAFARRYQTSCQTCHTIYPALTPFGEAFRRNGYRFPGDDDEDRTEEEPLELGHEIQADLFPDEVWPGQIPGNVPLAVYVMPMVSLQRGPGGGGHGAEAAVEPNDGGAPAPGWGTGFGGQMGLITAGNLGRHLSFFGKLEVSSDGDVSLERPNVTITPFDSPYLNIKLGNFEPSLLGFSIHRSLTGHQLAFTTSYLGDNEWTPEPTQTGIELNGTLAHRFSYSVGLVDGQANVLNRQKDVYGRLEYKFGGMSFDGTESTGYSQPWQELSMTVGASFYRGDATIRDPMEVLPNEHDTFWRAAADVSFHLKDATVILSGFRQEDNRPLITTSDSGNLTGAMAEVSYVVFPWMIPVLRYTMFRQNLPGEARTGQRITAGMAMLLRANVSVRLLASGVQNTGESATLEDATLALQATF